MFQSFRWAQNTQDCCLLIKPIIYWGSNQHKQAYRLQLFVYENETFVIFVAQNGTEETKEDSHCSSNKVELAYVHNVHYDTLVYMNLIIFMDSRQNWGGEYFCKFFIKR